MSTPQAENHRRVAGRFSTCVHGVGSRWNDPTPVAEWAVRDIVRHLIEWFPPFLASGADVDLGAGPSVDVDPVGAWEAQFAAVQALLDDPATATKTFANHHIGEVALLDAIDRFYTADVFMHTWDLARSTEQDDTLDAETCAALVEAMASFEDAMRNSGQYGPRVEVPDDASVQDRLIAFIGRDPNWGLP